MTAVARRGKLLEVGRDPSMRASDAEREEVAGALRESLADGRLDLSEFNERLDAAYSAKTYGDLETLLVDLPRPPGFGPANFYEAGAQLVDRWEARRAGRQRRRWSRFVTVNFVCWAIWALQTLALPSHHIETLWPLWVTVPWGLWLTRSRSVLGCGVRRSLSRGSSR